MSIEKISDHTSPAAAAQYAARAETTMRFVQTRLWDPSVGRYHPADPPEPGALPYDFMWGSGVAFSALVGGARLQPAVYRPLMEQFFHGLEAYWDKDAPIPGYDAYFHSPGDPHRRSDKYYDDNAWMALTYAEAYEITRDRRYLYRAAEVMCFVLSGWDDVLGGGIYWREDRKTKNTCSNGPAATAALALAPFTERAYFVDQARRIVDWTMRTLQAPNGLFWDNIDPFDGNRIERTEWTYNTALMLRANLGLYRATGERPYLDAARRMAQASERDLVNARTGAFRDDALFSHLLVEAYLDLYQTTGEPYLLDRARANAEFAYRCVRDPADGGGYWTKWGCLPNRREARKMLIANAGVARMYWLLASAPT